MKNVFNEEIKRINKDLYSSLENNNNNYKYNTYNHFKNDYNLNDIFNKINKRNKRKNKINNKNEAKEKICLTTYDIGNNLSNIKKQLNNISINEKNTLKIQKNKTHKSINEKMNNSTKIKNNLKNINIIMNKIENENKNKNIIQHQIHFSLLNSIDGKYDLITKNKELQNENDLLKENVKFLLSQIKKKKKIESRKSVKDTKLEKSNNSSNITNNNINNSINTNNNSKINNKIKSVFDIINKYKKEINHLKEELLNLNKENELLKKFVYNQNNSIDNNLIKSMKILNGNTSILRKPNFNNNNILLNHKLPLNQRNNNILVKPYRKKAFNKTFSHFKSDNYDSNISDKNNNFDTFTQTFKKHQNSNINNNSSNFTDKNTNKKFTFNSKNKHFILIDSDFKGEEKMGNSPQNLTINSNDRIFENKNNGKNDLSLLNNDLYYRKQINQFKTKKINFNGNIKRKKLLNEYNNRTLDSVISPKMNNDNNMKFKIKIMKYNKNNGS